MKEEWKLFLDHNLRVEVKAALLKEGIDTIHASDVQLSEVATLKSSNTQSTTVELS